MAPTALSFNYKSTPEGRQRLSEHFSGSGLPANDRWAALWDAGDFLPWDRGLPNPALEDTLKDHKDILGDTVFFNDGETGQKRRKRALVPGCGRGYDVLLLASFGYDAYGLEISTAAVKLSKDFAQEYGHNYHVQDEAVGAGVAKFIEGDFFKDDWFKEVPGGGNFEIIYDYTFLCAMNPSVRASWSLRHSQLLSPCPDSRLVCLEFPTNKSLALGGPSWGVSPQLYLALLGRPGMQIQYDSKGNVIEDQVGRLSAGGFLRVAHWQPERTHEVGKGTDWVSVWRKVC